MTPDARGLREKLPLDDTARLMWLARV